MNDVEKRIDELKDKLKHFNGDQPAKEKLLSELITMYALVYDFENINRYIKNLVFEKFHFVLYNKDFRVLFVDTFQRPLTSIEFSIALSGLLNHINILIENEQTFDEGLTALHLLKHLLTIQFENFLKAIESFDRFKQGLKSFNLMLFEKQWKALETKCHSYRRHQSRFSEKLQFYPSAIEKIWENICDATTKLEQTSNISNSKLQQTRITDYMPAYQVSHKTLFRDSEVLIAKISSLSLEATKNPPKKVTQKKITQFFNKSVQISDGKQEINPAVTNL